jgi:hypothetical protein
MPILVSTSKLGCNLENLSSIDFFGSIFDQLWQVTNLPVKFHKMS